MFLRSTLIFTILLAATITRAEALHPEPGPGELPAPASGPIERQMPPKVIRSGAIEELKKGTQLTLLKPLMLKGSPTVFMLWTKKKLGPCDVSANENFNLNSDVLISSKVKWTFTEATESQYKKDDRQIDSPMVPIVLLNFVSKGIDPQKVLTLHCPPGTDISQVTGTRFAEPAKTVEIIKPNAPVKSQVRK